MATMLLCSSAGINAYVVEGWQNDTRHYWNIVNIRGRLYHIDLYNAATAGEPVEFLLDEDMESRYSWDREIYPACENPEAEGSNQ